jgi:hypothetical protein
MATVPPVRWAFFPLDEELDLRPNVGFTPRLEESMVRLSTWMPFRPASRELAFFTGVQVAEATIRQLTEQAGAVQVRLQDDQMATLLRERPESPTGPNVQLISLDGCYLQMVGGEWKEVKTLALGEVAEPVEERGEQVVHTSELSYFSRMSEAEQFQRAALVEIHARGVEQAGTVCAVSDGADWIPKFVDYHRQDAVRILDFAHAMEYVAEAGQAAHDHLACPDEMTKPEERTKFKQARFQQWLKEQRRELKAGDAGKVLDELTRLQTLMQASQAESAVETITKKLSYLRERHPMLAYATFQAQGYPIGSGSVESANKLVVQSRMKGAGMRWEPAHVNAMLALRNVACNDRWASGWVAIRQRWQQDRQSKRAVRAQPASPQVEPAQTTPAPREHIPACDQGKPLRKGEPTTHATPAGTTTLKPTQAQPTRPATTHPWRKPFLRRRPA